MLLLFIFYFTTCCILKDIIIQFLFKMWDFFHEPDYTFTPADSPFRLTVGSADCHVFAVICIASEVNKPFFLLRIPWSPLFIWLQTEFLFSGGVSGISAKGIIDTDEDHLWNKMSWLDFHSKVHSVSLLFICRDGFKRKTGHQQTRWAQCGGKFYENQVERTRKQVLYVYLSKLKVNFWFFVCDGVLE